MTAVSLLKNKVQIRFGKQRTKQRKGSSGSESSGNARRGSPTGRVIPPEPVQQRPDGEFHDNEAAPALQAHNLSRASKMSKKLEWDDRLASDAEAWAQQLAEIGELEHSEIENQGENIFMIDGDAKYEDAVQNWLNGEKKYSGERVGEVNFEEWGQFGKFLCTRTSIFHC